MLIRAVRARECAGTDVNALGGVQRCGCGARGPLLAAFAPLARVGAIKLSYLPVQATRMAAAPFPLVAVRSGRRQCAPGLRAIVVLVTLQWLAPACGTDVVLAQGNPTCESRLSWGDVRDFTCALDASGAAHRYLFKANFAGSHDDTTASMTASLNGSPLVCEEGSKISLMGEDGDVSLECKFSLAQQAGTKHLLRVTLKWHHAQYVDFEFRSR